MFLTKNKLTRLVKLIPIGRKIHEYLDSYFWNYWLDPVKKIITLDIISPHCEKFLNFINDEKRGDLLFDILTAFDLELKTKC